MGGALLERPIQVCDGAAHCCSAALRPLAPVPCPDGLEKAVSDRL